MRVQPGQSSLHFIGSAQAFSGELSEALSLTGDSIRALSPIIVAFWADQAQALSLAEGMPPGTALILLDVPESENPSQPSKNRLALLPKKVEGESQLHDIQLAIQALEAGIRLIRPESRRAKKREKGFSPRELQILNLLADGKANKEIAAALEISEGTVKFHLGELFSKLGASNRAQAVRRGLESGLLSL